VFTVGFTYVFLLEPARYLNHFYLMCLLGLLLAVVPAHRRWSVDAALRPRLRSDTAPAWALWLLRAQVAIVYVYGGLAKVNGDWLAGEPMRAWLAARPDFPLLGGFLAGEWTVDAASYGGLLLDLLVVPAVLWRRTRVPALCAAALFHLANRELFSIGVFPYLAMAALLLLCPPSWPRDLLGRVGIRIGPVAGAEAASRARPLPSAAVAALVGYLAVQLLVPLRHHLYTGDPNWTEAGHTFAWRMMLRDKWGDASFVVRDPSSGRTWTVDPATVLTPLQEAKMAVRPELIRQVSHELARRFQAAGHPGVQVYAHVRASLNGRHLQPLVARPWTSPAGPSGSAPTRGCCPHRAATSLTRRDRPTASQAAGAGSPCPGRS
jgi:vitamin K-dependent gamma-carboxylase